jgi:hypothetical protein
LIGAFNGNYQYAMTKRKPHATWDPERYADALHPEWLEGPVPMKFWQDPRNHKRYMQWLGRRLGFRKPDDWYRVTINDFKDNHGSGFLSVCYDSSPILAVTTNFPDHDWKEWLFTATPHGFWDDPRNRNRYMQWLGRRLGIRKPDDWYRVTSHDFRNNHGRGMLSLHYADSPVLAVTANFPDHDWKEWLFPVTPSGFWNEKRNRIRYLRWLEKQLGLKKPEDWYTVEQKEFQKHNGWSLIFGFYKRSMIAAVRELYPEREWHEWRFPIGPRAFWRKRENLIRYFNWLGKKLGFRKPEDWYRLTQRQLLDNHGGGFSQELYNGSPVAAVKDVFPEHDWKEWLFSYVPHGFWKLPANRIRYLRWLEEQLGMNGPEDWYRVTAQDFLHNAGSGLLGLAYGGSVSRAAKELYPKHDWCEWLFTQSPHGLWRSRDTRRRYMRWLGKRLGFRCPLDWCGVRKADFLENHGSHFLNCVFGRSIVAALQDYLPHVKWSEDRLKPRKRKMA